MAWTVNIKSVLEMPKNCLKKNSSVVTQKLLTDHCPCLRIIVEDPIWQRSKECQGPSRVFFFTSAVVYNLATFP